MSKKNKYTDIDELEEVYDEKLFKTENNALEQESAEDEEDTEEEDEEGTDNKDKSYHKSHRHRLMNSLLNNEGETNINSVKDLFKSIELNGEWFRRNLSFIIVTTICLMGFVTNRYQAQQEQIEEARLKKELAEMKYKWLTRFSELTTFTRQSRIEELLRINGDTTLTHSKEAPFLIRANKESHDKE